MPSRGLLFALPSFMEGDIAMLKGGGWSPSVVEFVEESGLNVGNKNVCEACCSSIRNSMKVRDNGEPSQLR